MIDADKIAVLERMRDLLSDPDRVVLDPDSMYETNEGEPLWTLPESLPPDCRVCLIGAENLAYADLKLDNHGEVEEVVWSHIQPMGFESCTAVLQEGRAVEVVDACLADLRSVAA